MKKSNLQLLLEFWLEYQKISYAYYDTHRRQARLRAWSIAISRIMLSSGVLVFISAMKSEDLITILDHLLK